MSLKKRDISENVSDFGNLRCKNQKRKEKSKKMRHGAMKQSNSETFQKDFLKCRKFWILQFVFRDILK